MKPLAGKRAFYAMGQRSIHIDYAGIWPQPTWPTWARLEFFKGQDAERRSKARQTVKTWPADKLVAATQ
jgi:hypothetical protein